MKNKTVLKMSKGDLAAFNSIRNFFQPRIHSHIRITLSTREHKVEMTDYIFQCLCEVRYQMTTVRQVKRHLANALMAYDKACKKVILIEEESNVIFEKLSEEFSEVIDYDEKTKTHFRLGMAFFRGSMINFHDTSRLLNASEDLMRAYVKLTLPKTAEVFRELWPQVKSER